MRADAARGKDTATTRLAEGPASMFNPDRVDAPFLQAP